MTPELKSLFASILLRESALLELLGEQEDYGMIHEFTLHQIYAETGSYHEIADYLGIPSLEPFELSQVEYAKGECRHGVRHYCRDWIGAAMAGRAKEFPGDSEEARFAAFLDEMIRSAEQCKGIDFGPCPKCEAAFLTAG